MGKKRNAGNRRKRAFYVAEPVRVLGKESFFQTDIFFKGAVIPAVAVFLDPLLKINLCRGVLFKKAVQPVPMVIMGMGQNGKLRLGNGNSHGFGVFRE